mgnify:CR=1 FL=1
MNIEILSDFIFQNVEVNVVFVSSSGDTDNITEIVDGFGRVTSSSHAVDGKDSWVIPTLDSVGENKFVEFSLGKHVVGNVKSGILPNVRFVKVESVKDPVIKFSSDFEFQ